MIRANLDAAIAAKQKEIDVNRDEIIRLDKVIETIKAEQKRLLERDTDLCYELEDLKDEMQNND